MPGQERFGHARKGQAHARGVLNGPLLLFQRRRLPGHDVLQPREHSRIAQRVRPEVTRLEHLIHANHTVAFLEWLERAMPDYEIRRGSASLSGCRSRARTRPPGITPAIKQVALGGPDHPSLPAGYASAKQRVHPMYSQTSKSFPGVSFRCSRQPPMSEIGRDFPSTKSTL